MATVPFNSEGVFGSRNNISNLPRDLTGKILDCLSVQEAVKTSILSKTWRYNWTKLSQLKFDSSFYSYLENKGGLDLVCDYLRIINRVLLHHDGTILNFFLRIPKASFSQKDLDEIGQWFILLSRKGKLKEFTFLNYSSHPQKLPMMFFSCRDLTYLNLAYCTINIPPASVGFPFLESLKFKSVKFEANIFLMFVSRSSLLERMELHSCNISGSLEDLLASIAKDSISALDNLKILKLSSIDFSSNSNEVLLFTSLICFSENLQELHISTNGVDEEQELDAWRAEGIMKQLHSIYFKLESGLRSELKLIKFLLARSPLLETLYIHRDEANGIYDESVIGYKLVRQLMSFPRASPKAKILYSDSILDDLYSPN